MAHIVFTVTTDLTYDQRMSRICQALYKNGYDVTIVGRKKRESTPLINAGYRQKRLNCIFQKGPFFYAEYNFRLFFYLLFVKTSIISAADIDSALPALIVAKVRGKKFVFDSHEYFTEVIELQDKPFVKKIWQAIESFVVKRTRVMYTVSGGLKKLFFEKYGKEFEVIRNVPLLNERSANETNEKYFVYAGAVNAGRGLEELIDIWDQVPVNLYVCGDGDKLMELKKIVIEKNLQDKIIFKGYLKPEDLRKKIAGAYAGFLLLKNESLSYYYSLANKFFDYVHAEIPQVTIDFPEYAALNNEHEVAILVGLNKKEILNAIQLLLKDAEIYARLKKNCLLAKKDWNWEKESVKLLAIYEKALSL